MRVVRMMADSGEYKQTVFDRHGRDAMQVIWSWAIGLMIFIVVAGVLLAYVGFRWWVLPVAVALSAAAHGLGLLIGHVMGATWTPFVTGRSTAQHEEQYAYQQALAMRGQIDEALESFEAVIAEHPDAVSPRVKAAELYAREKKNPRRAAELFRDARRSGAITAGEDVYVTHRLVDLLVGPLADEGRALVELRRLIERYPGSAAAEHARQALTELKSRKEW